MSISHIRCQGDPTVVKSQLFFIFLFQPLPLDVSQVGLATHEHPQSALFSFQQLPAGFDLHFPDDLDLQNPLLTEDGDLILDVVNLVILFWPCRPCGSWLGHSSTYIDC